MNFDAFQLIVGMASANKIGQEFRSKPFFARFDVLAPNVPGGVWQFTKHLLSVPHNFVASQAFKKHQLWLNPVSKSLSNNEKQLFVSHI